MRTDDSTGSSSCTLNDVPPELLERWIADSEAVLVDVREDFEYALEHIDGSIHHALSKFNSETLKVICDGKRAVFHCRTGGRSSEAARKYADSEENVFHLQGGIEGWKASGRSTIRAAAAPKIDVMRQVQVVAGTLILTGVILGALVNPWLYGISAFVGCGLMFAGLTGWCGMAILLGKMPWNKVGRIGCEACCKPN